jgi:hypothetical protein
LRRQGVWVSGLKGPASGGTCDYEVPEIIMFNTHVMISSVHTYRPLPNKTIIRVLRLEPTLEHSALLFASLERFDIAQHPEDKMTAICNDRDMLASSSNTRGLPQIEYEAASYALGHKDFTLTLNFVGAVPSEVISIRRNMDDMVRYIRPISQQRHLWIDALCINQYNVKEKDAQVKLMGVVYQQEKQ